MTPEEIRTALNSAIAKNDEFYTTLTAVMTNWYAVCDLAAAAIPQGTTKDVRAVKDNVQAGHDGLMMLVDASIHLGQALGGLSVQF